VVTPPSLARGVHHELRAWELALERSNDVLLKHGHEPSVRQVGKSDPWIGEPPARGETPFEIAKIEAELGAEALGLEREGATVSTRGAHAEQTKVCPET